MKQKCPSLFKARPTRNGQDTIDLVAALLSNGIDAIFQAVIIRPWEGHGRS